MRWIFLIIVLISIQCAYADEMALFNRDEVNKYINETRAEDVEDNESVEIQNNSQQHNNEQSLTDHEEDTYLDQEEQKIREINLLSLDVEKKGLEYKHQLINSRINKLNNIPELKNKEQSVVDQVNISINVVATVISENHKYGIVVMNGVRFKVVEKQIIDQFQVLIINKGVIKFKFPDGQERDVFIS